MFLFFALCALAVLAFVIRAFQGVDELRDHSDSSPSDIYAEKQGILHLLQNKLLIEGDETALPDPEIALKPGPLIRHGHPWVA